MTLKTYIYFGENSMLYLTVFSHFMSVLFDELLIQTKVSLFVQSYHACPKVSCTTVNSSYFLWILRARSGVYPIQKLASVSMPSSINSQIIPTSLHSLSGIGTRVKLEQAWNRMRVLASVFLLALTAASFLPNCKRFPSDCYGLDCNFDTVYMA